MRGGQMCSVGGAWVSGVAGWTVAGAVFAARCKSQPSPLLAPLQAMIKGDKQAAAAAGSNVLEVGGTHLAVPDF